MLQNKQKTDSFRRHRPFYKTPLFWFFVIVLVIAGGVFAVLHFTKKPSVETSTVTSSSASHESANATTELESSSPDTSPTSSDNTSSTSPDGKTPAQYDGADPNLDGSITGFLSTARFDGDNLILRVSVDQYLPGGSCVLVASDGANSLEKSANLVPVVSTSTCEGFDISSSELTGFSRPISIKINLASGEKSGIIEGSVE